LNRSFKFRQFLLDDSPYDFEVHAEIVVNDFVAHPCDLLPRDVRLAGFCFVGEVLDRLADHLELAECGVLSHALVEERIAARAGVSRNVLQRVADVSR